MQPDWLLERLCSGPALPCDPGYVSRFLRILQTRVGRL